MAELRSPKPVVGGSSPSWPANENEDLMGRLENVKEYITEVSVELKKTTFPSREKTMGSSVVVIVMVLFMSLFLALADFVLAKLVGVILR